MIFRKSRDADKVNHRMSEDAQRLRMTYPVVGRLRANHGWFIRLAQIWIMTSKDGICCPDTEIRELPSRSVCR